jgi:hypothetical protein
MKLIAKTKDYYDMYANNPAFSDMSWNRVWRREPKSVTCDFSLPVGFTYEGVDRHGILDYRHDLLGCCIHFCGDIYPVIIYTKDNSCYYNFDDVIGFIPERYTWVTDRLRKFFACETWTTKIGKGHKLAQRLSNVEMHRKLNTPVFISGNYREDGRNGRYADRERVFINPILDSLKFIQKVDAFACMLRLEQFLSNDLVVPDLKEVKISDKLKAETHGFNKFSFRKDKA